MLHRQNRSISGFTLVELAIVLGVAGVLFGGLWRLLSTSNQQMRDQSTAAQHAQLISAVNAYLQSSGALASSTGGGQQFLAGIAANTSKALVLPTAAAPAAGSGAALTNCAAGIGAANNPGLCSFLPAGFNVNTVNSYGQTYMIRVLKDGTAAGTVPASYSFMIVTTSTTADISDTSGGRISAMIGGDGGFLYTANVCGAPASTVCGSYGAWSATPATAASSTYYGYAVANLTSGHVASRTYSISAKSIGDPWLARIFMAGDTAATPVYNTMTTPLFLGGQTSYFGSNSGLTTGGGTMNVQGGTIALGDAGIISGTAGAGGLGFGGASITLNGTMVRVGASIANPILQLNSSCSKVDFNDTNCNYVASFQGSVTVKDLLYSKAFYADQFVYQSSDVRLKKNVQALSNSLLSIMKLKPVSFVFRANDKKSMGVIAQDLEKIFPQLVIEGPDGMKGVSYEGLIAPLVGAVQELKKENDVLRVQMRDQILQQEKIKQEMNLLRKK